MMLQQALARSPTTARPQAPRRDVVTASASQTASSQQLAPRRRALLAGAAAAVVLPPLVAATRPALAEEAAPAPSEAAAAPAAAAPASIKVLEDQPGSGTAAAKPGDLVLVHYKGTCVADGLLFDSTLGGAMYRDGGIGVLRPVIIRLGGAPVPGVCDGLQRGIEGMTVGGRRTFAVPPALGFGAGTVLGPYGIVPSGSELRYEVQLLRLSRQGPDALMSGVSMCGAGTANERNSGCADISLAEFV